MIKKSTLIVLLVAILGGGAVYYFDWQRGQKEAAKAVEDKSKPAFTVQSGDISALMISYPADAKSQTIRLESAVTRGRSRSRSRRERTSRRWRGSWRSWLPRALVRRSRERRIV